MAKSVCELTESVGVHDIVKEIPSLYDKINPALFKAYAGESITFYLIITCNRERRAFEELIFACGGDCVEKEDIDQWTVIVSHSYPFLKGKRPCFQVTYITDCIKENSLLDISKYQFSPVTEVNPMDVIFFRKDVFCNIKDLNFGPPVDDTSTSEACESESSSFSLGELTVSELLQRVNGESCFCEFGPKPGESAAPNPEPAAPTPESAAPNPEPGTFYPESATPIPEPGATVREPAAHIPEPAAPIPEPAAPIPESAAHIPEPTAPNPEPAAPISEQAAPIPEPVATVPEPAAHIPGPAASIPETAAPVPEERKNTRIVNKRTRMPYTWNEKEAILRHLVKFKRYKNLRGNTYWKVMEIRNVCPRRTYQSMKEHFTKVLVHELDRFDFITPEEKQIFKQYRK